MPKAQSDTRPDDFTKSRGKTQVNYNIVSKELTDDQGTRTIFEYDYVEISGTVTKLKIFEVMYKADAESDTSEITPDDIANQVKDSKDVLALSELTGITYAQLDTYINNNVTDLASTKAYLKKLSKVVLATVKNMDLN